MSTQPWERIVDAVPDPLVLVDRRARVIRANPAALRLLGHRQDAEQLADLVAAPFSEERWIERLEASARVGSSLQLVTFAEDGKHLEATVHPVGPAQEDPLLLRLRLREPESGLDAAREALDASNALLETLFERAPIGLAFFTRDLRYAQVNRQLEALNRKPRAEHIGRRVTEVLGPAGAALEGYLTQVVESLEPVVRVEVTSDELALPVGQSWQASFYPVLVEHDLIGVGAVIEDTTERTRADRDRARLLAEAQAAVRLREEFLSIASHELKTPLTPLWMRLAMLERSLEHGQPIDIEQVRKARASLATLTALINDLLDASRITAGRMSVQLARLRLDELVRRLADGGERDGHPLQLALPEGPLEVYGDGPRLEQVIDNLLDNAAKYSPPGAPIELVLEKQGDRIRLAVIDAGIGIPEEEQHRLFQRYFRAHNAKRVVAGGMGLGLYIGRDIVERHGGSMGVQSRPGEGSRFWMDLPAASAWRGGFASDPH